MLIVERYVLARLRNRRFFSLVELNAGIREIVADLNAKIMRKLAARPTSRPSDPRDPTG